MDFSNEKATGGSEEAGWRSTLEAEEADVGGVQVEAAGAEATAHVERDRVERMMKEDKAEEQRSAALTRAKVDETISGIASGSVASPRRASAVNSPYTYMNRDECEVAARNRARLEKIAKEMADLVATRKQEREHSAKPGDLQNLR